LELIQDSLRDRGDPKEIAQVLRIVHPAIDIRAVFWGGGDGGDGSGVGGGATKATTASSVFSTHFLRCFFCFHPHKHHYVVYCFDEPTRLWFAFDDDKVSLVSLPDYFWHCKQDICLCLRIMPFKRFSFNPALDRPLFFSNSP
jgi:hypothetical protein